jgi:fatty acid desaturase
MNLQTKLIKNRAIQIFIGLVFLVGCIALLSSGTVFVKEYSIALLIVFVLIVAVFDLRG